MGARIKQSVGRWEQSQSCSPASCSRRLCCLFTSPSLTHKDRVKLNLLSCAVAFKRHTVAWKDAAERPVYGLWGRVSLTLQTVLFLNLHYKEAPSKKYHRTHKAKSSILTTCSSPAIMTICKDTFSLTIWIPGTAPSPALPKPSPTPWQETRCN